MDKVVTLFPDQVMVTHETPAQLLKRLDRVVVDSNKAIVILIDDRAGKWKVDFHTASTTNAETIIAFEIVRETIMNAILGKQ